jgi:signal transduction histidine kinase
VKSSELDARAYQAAFQLSADATAFVGPDDRIVTTNEAFADIFEEGGQEGAAFAAPFAPEERPRVGNLLRDAHRWSEASAAGVRLGEGRGLLVDLWASQFVTADGEPLLLVRARSASARLEAERLHEAAVLAARACNQATTWAQLSQSVHGVVKRVLPQTSGATRLRHVEGGWVAAGPSGSLEPWADSAPFPDASIWGRFARERESVLLADVPFELGGEDPGLEPAVPAASLIASPILAGDKADGLLVVVAGEVAAFSLEDVRCLDAVTRELASAIVRLEAYEALAESHARLSDAFEQNKALLARVSRLNAELEDFALWTTHDLREPLRGLAALAEFVSTEALHGGGRELGELAGQLGLSATRLKQHIRSLHEFHEAARDSTRREDVPLERLAQDALANAGVPDARLVARTPDLRVHADPARVTNAIADMLAFAAGRASTPLVVDLAEAGPATVRLAIALREEVTGRGAEAAFHVLGQPGSLALARRIALQHGGSLAFESTPPCLALLLPATRTTPSARMTSAATEGPG